MERLGDDWLANALGSTWRADSESFIDEPAKSHPSACPRRPPRRSRRSRPPERASLGGRFTGPNGGHFDNVSLLPVLPRPQDGDGGSPAPRIMVFYIPGHVLPPTAYAATPLPL